MPIEDKAPLELNDDIIVGAWRDIRDRLQEV
jgi:hypothetical protein